MAGTGPNEPREFHSQLRLKLGREDKPEDWIHYFSHFINLIKFYSQDKANIKFT